MPTQKHFDQHLIYMNLYQHAKNQAIPLICFGGNFPKYGFCAGTQKII